jgi:hypothetical protein
MNRNDGSKYSVLGYTLHIGLTTCKPHVFALQVGIRHANEVEMRGNTWRGVQRMRVKDPLGGDFPRERVTSRGYFLRMPSHPWLALLTSQSHSKGMLPILEHGWCRWMVQMQMVARRPLAPA